MRAGRRGAACLLLAVVAVAGCAAEDGTASPDAPVSEATASVTPSTEPSEPPASASPTPPAFEASIGSVPADRLPHSWRSGCPVGPDELRLLTLSYWGFDGAPHTGELVVAASVAEDVAGAFLALYEQRFTIRRMVLVDEYGGDDNRSMAADNTSGFNCRTVPGSDALSQHAYGLAVDINPCENPYVLGDGTVLPPECAGFTDRALDEPGMIRPGDPVVRAFAGIGWEWGGDWANSKDYQHFAVPR